MDYIEIGKKVLNKVKLFLLYFVRIVFAKNNFKVSFITKIKANLLGGYLGDQWVLYDLDHNDRKEYLSEFDWYRSRYINQPFDFLMNNKIACAEILKQYVMTPENYVVKKRGIMSTFQKEVISLEEACDIIKEKENMFIKPYGAGKGNGVNNFRYNKETEEYSIDNEIVSKEDIIKELDSRDKWLLCQGIEQDSYANTIYDKTINTMRIIALRDVKTEEFKIFFAVQRWGTKETIPVDNGSRGGLVSKIDLDTGVLSEARSLHNLNVYDNHPDSGQPIKGVAIPNWEEIKRQVLELTRKFPYMNFIAWDIILQGDKICVIEANTSSGVNIIQLWGGQRYGELGDFYRHHNVRV